MAAAPPQRSGRLIPVVPIHPQGHPNASMQQRSDGRGPLDHDGERSSHAAQGMEAQMASITRTPMI